MPTSTIRELRPKSGRRQQPAKKSVVLPPAGVTLAQAASPSAPAKPQARFNAEAHVKWLRKVWGDEKPVTDSGKWLAAVRADRVLVVKR